MKIRTYTQKLIPILLEQELITKEDEQTMTDYLNNTYGGEEYA